MIADREDRGPVLRGRGNPAGRPPAAEARRLWTEDGGVQKGGGWKRTCGK